MKHLYRDGDNSKMMEDVRIGTPAPKAFAMAPHKTEVIKLANQA